MDSRPDYGASLQVWMPPNLQQALKVITKPNWDGTIAFAVRASAREAVKDPAIAGRSGVYILLGPGSSSSKSRLYVGESDVINDRLLQQEAAKEWWDTLICLIQPSSNLDKSQVKLLESLLIQRAIAADRVELDNERKKPYEHANEATKAHMQAFLHDSLECLRLFEIRHFDPLPKVGDSPATLTAPVYSYDTKSANARGWLTQTNAFIVLEGSTAVGDFELADTMPATYREQRRQLIKEGVLAPDGQGRLKFTRDYEFSAPSPAAAVVGGHSVSGWNAWKSAQGRKLSDVIVDTVT
jgi:hypothetical protein